MLIEEDGGSLSLLMLMPAAKLILKDADTAAKARPKTDIMDY